MTPEQLKNIFNQLIGTWDLKRSIFDRFGESKFRGECRFSKLSDVRLLCEESGTLTYNGHQSDASRSYIYELQDDKIVILYNDAHRSGDILHELEFTNKDKVISARHCHECGQDRYDLTFEFSNHGHIQMYYVVKGSHKDYRMVSELVRR
jgi:hypothetical protein